MKAARFRYGRLYKAYFFEEPIVEPISVTIVARSFEEALALVREQFPARTISAFNADDTYRLRQDFHAVIIAPNLPRTEPPKLPCDFRGVPEEVSRGWFNRPKDRNQPADEETTLQ
jgi:hypothetical protein